MKKQILYGVLLLHLFSCNNIVQHSQGAEQVASTTSVNAQTQNIVSLIEDFSKLKKIAVKDIKVISENVDSSIGKHEVTALLSGDTHKGRKVAVYIHLLNSDDNNWCISEYGEEADGKIKYNGCYPVLTQHVIQSRMQMNIIDESYN